MATGPTIRTEAAKDQGSTREHSESLVPPLRIVDPHHHFFAPSLNPALHATLSSAGIRGDHLPSDHARDFSTSTGLEVVASVHVEALPDNAVDEVLLVEALASESAPETYGEANRASFVRAVVASCDLSAPDAAARLEALMAASPTRLRGVRWITNFAGALEPGEAAIVSRATWPRVAKDFSTDPDFEFGLGLLPRLGLSFDLQANPRQLPRWARVIARHPGLVVVLDHLGHPRGLGQGDAEHDAAELAAWRHGMTALAALPNVNVKLSMLGYAVPGWWADEGKEALVKGLVLETVERFGSERFGATDRH